MINLDDAMKVLLQNDFIDKGYIDDDGNAEVVRNELEQKCYFVEKLFKENKFVLKENESMDKMRIENAELIQRVLQLEKDLGKERAYNYALVTVIKNNYPT